MKKIKVNFSIHAGKHPDIKYWYTIGLIPNICINRSANWLNRSVSYAIAFTWLCFTISIEFNKGR